MSHNLFHFFSREAGQARRKALDEAIGGLVEYLTPPNLRPVTEFVAQANPIQGMSDSMAASGVVFDPKQTAEAKKRAGLDMGIEMAFALTPAALAARGYLTPVQGMMEGLLGGSPAQKTITDDLVERFTQPGQVPVMGSNFANIKEQPDLPFDPSLYPYNADGSLQQVEMYSPTLRAAENLKQEKGTYEQMKAMMLKSGAREDEFEWSGANDYFGGTNVTKEGLINYLQRYNPKLEVQKNIGGKTGYSDLDELDDYEIIDEVMQDQPMMSELRNEYMDNFYYENLQEDARSDYSNYFDINDLSDENLNDLAEYFLKENPDKFPAALKDRKGDYLLDNFQYVYFPNAERRTNNEFIEDKFDPEDAEIFEYADEAVYHQYGGAEGFNEDVDHMIREMFEEDLRYDRPQFMARYGINPEPDELDVGDTEFMEYFPSEGENYTENLFRFRDPLDEIDQDNLPSASHFYDPEGLLIHTRQADFKTKDGEKVRYIGEIQSDVAQRLQRRNRRDQETIEKTGGYMDYPEPTRQGLLNKQEQVRQDQIRRSARSRGDTREETVENILQNISANNEELGFPLEFSYDEKLIAPFMTENKFVDQAIRNSFFDAIKDDVPILAFPADERAIGEVGGTSYPAQGAVDFYRKNVQNRLKAFLKKYDKDAKPEIIEIKREEEGNFPVFGVRITPQLKRSIIEKGLPTYGIGATGILGYGAAQEEKKKQGLLEM